MRYLEGKRSGGGVRCSYMRLFLCVIRSVIRSGKVRSRECNVETDDDKSKRWSFDPPLLSKLMLCRVNCERSRDDR